MLITSKAVFASFLSAYLRYIQFRVEFFLLLISGATPIFMMFAWQAVAIDGAVGEGSGNWFAAYFFVVYGMRQLNPIWLIREMDDQIRLGHLSHHLLRPVGLYWRLIGYHLADNAIRLPIVVAIVGAGLWGFGAIGYIKPNYVSMYLISMLLGMLLGFHLELLVSFLAFWTDQAIAIENLYFTTFTLATGLIVPLNMLPTWAGDLLRWTPWPYIFSLPTEILLGQLSEQKMLYGIAVQGVWLTVAALLGRLLWSFGLRRYSAVGS